MSSADAAAGLIDRARSEFGEALVGEHAAAGPNGAAGEYGLWVRVHRDAWGEMAAWLRFEEGFGFFGFLSAIDWMPSPFGRDMDSAVDNVLDPPDPKPSPPNPPGPMSPPNPSGPMSPPSASGPSSPPNASSTSSASGKQAPPVETGVAGGDTRFQVFARVNDVNSHRSVMIKADLPDGDLRAPSWVPVYPGADWHEREAWEMFGIAFDGHPGLRHLYLPGQFEGNPLRKDYPLLARRVKPWPGLVDVELMPDPAVTQ